MCLIDIFAKIGSRPNLFMKVIRLVGTLLSLSVVISTYTKKRLSEVMRCISSLKNQTVSPAEIILVLDPCDELGEFYKHFVPNDIKIVMSSERGLSHARNTGIKNAIGEIVAFIDDDAFADRTWLEYLIANYEDPQIMGVGGLVKAIWADERPFWFPEELDWIVGCSYKGFQGGKSIIRNPIGCNMSFRRTVFEKIGYFRTDMGRFGKMLLSNEETELSIRLYKKMPNSKIIYEPSAIVYHNVPKDRETLKYICTRSFYEGISKALISSQKKLPATLSQEDLYLKYLLGNAIPSRFKQNIGLKNICQTLILLLSMFAVLTGYAAYKLGD